MKKFIPFFSVCLAVVSLTSCESPSSSKTVGLVVPMQHPALEEIVEGFSQTLLKENPSLQLKVQNAAGEASLQQAIIEQFAHQQVDLILPIGLAATQMCSHKVKKIPIVSLAAKIEKQAPNLTGVNDELETDMLLNFALETFQLKHLTLVHSPSEKIFPEVEKLKSLCLNQGVRLDCLGIQSQSDLYTVAKQIDPQSQLILVLKDHLVVSAISILSKRAQELQQPLMSCDDGSVGAGAAFALGVKEHDIGVQGAQIALEVLSGKNPGEIPLQNLTSIHLFINPDACKKQGVSLPLLQESAQKHGIHLVYKE